MKSENPEQSRGKTAYLAVGLLLLLGAVLVLVFTANTAPTTPDTRRLFGLWRLPHVVLSTFGFIFGLGVFALSGRRERFLGFVSILGTLFLCIGLLEGVGRAGLISWEGLFRPAQVGGEAVGWSPVPNQRVTGETYQDIATRFELPSDPIPFDVATDKYGFRNSDDEIANVIVLGDSIVFGGQTQKENTIDAVVEATLNQPVSQVALLGLSIQEQHELLLNSGIDLSGKTVVQLFFEGNDLLDSARFRAPKTSGEGLKSSSFVKTVWGLATKATDPTSPWESADYCTVKEQRILFLWTRRSFDGHMSELTHVQQSIKRFATQLNEVGGTYALVFVPTKYRVLNDLCTYPEGSPLSDPSLHLSSIPNLLGEWSKEMGIPYLDLTTPLTNTATQGDNPWLWGDTHWGDTGHRISGEAIGRWDALLDETR